MSVYFFLPFQCCMFPRIPMCVSTCLSDSRKRKRRRGWRRRDCCLQAIAASSPCSTSSASPALPFPPSRSHAAVFNLVYLPCTLPIPVFLLSWGYHLSLCWTTTPGGGFLWCVACPPHLPQPTWMPWIFFSRS